MGRKNGAAPATTQKGDRMTLVLDWTVGEDLRHACWECNQTLREFVTGLLRDHGAQYVARNRVKPGQRAKGRGGPRLRLTTRPPQP